MSASPSTIALEAGFRMINDEAARKFVVLARSIGGHSDLAQVEKHLDRTIGGTDHLTDVIAKANISGHTVAEEVWGSPAVQDLASAYLGRIAPWSIFDSIRRFAQIMPRELDRVVISAGGVASIAEEGAPKAVTRLNLSFDEASLKKACAIVVFSNELARTFGGATNVLFERELRKAVIDAFNDAALASFDSVAISSTGSLLGDLKAGLAVADASDGYVVAMQRQLVRELALQAEGRMAINGGDFIPGVAVVPVDADSASPQMTIIPASRVSLLDRGLVVRNAGHASVEMADDPHSPSQQVSLWQANSQGLLVERTYRMASASPAVTVG